MQKKNGKKNQTFPFNHPRSSYGVSTKPCLALAELSWPVMYHTLRITESNAKSYKKKLNFFLKAHIYDEQKIFLARNLLLKISFD